MWPTVRPRLAVVVVIVGLLAGGYGLRQLFRDPIGNLPVRSRSEPTRHPAATIRPTRPPPAVEGFVGSAACAECHEAGDFEGEDAAALTATLKKMVAGQQKHKTALKLSDAEIADLAVFMSAGK